MPTCTQNMNAKFKCQQTNFPFKTAEFNIGKNKWFYLKPASVHVNYVAFRYYDIEDNYFRSLSEQSLMVYYIEYTNERNKMITDLSAIGFDLLNNLFYGMKAIERYSEETNKTAFGAV